MRILIAVGAAVLAGSALAAEEQEKSSFLENNPGYRERAGKFYEEKYLPGAARGLVAAFAPQVLPEETATGILRDFIYEFLDQYIADGGGGISRRGHANVLAKLDARVRELADGPEVLSRYEAWKAGSKEEFPNPLAFLTLMRFQSPPVSLTLSAELIEKGWSVRSLVSLAETAEYADVLELEPDQVFVLERKGDAAEPSRAMTLLLYRSKDAPRLLTALEARTKRERADEKNAAALLLFWRTSRHVIFLLEPTPVKDGDELKQWVRAQWVSL